MKFLIFAILTAAAPLAFAADNSSDTSFYKHLAQGGMSEVDLGKLAAQKSTDAKVKSFAEMMVKDHSSANQKLESLASSKNVTLPKTLDASHEATKTKLEALSGHSFDKSYVEGQLKDHEKTVHLLETEISSGKDADAKAFAESVLPTVKQHLQAARELASEEGVKSASR
jgi:putative membrane protein